MKYISDHFKCWLIALLLHCSPFLMNIHVNSTQMHANDLFYIWLELTFLFWGYCQEKGVSGFILICWSTSLLYRLDLHVCSCIFMKSIKNSVCMKINCLVQKHFSCKPLSHSLYINENSIHIFDKMEEYICTVLAVS